MAHFSWINVLQQLNILRGGGGGGGGGELGSTEIWTHDRWLESPHDHGFTWETGTAVKFISPSLCFTEWSLVHFNNL